MCAEIVSFADRHARRAHPVLAQVEAYWDGLRDGHDCPARAQVRPEGLTGVLSHSFILEKSAPGTGRFRVAGRHLTEMAKLEVRGLSIAALFLPEARDRLEAALERVYSGPAIQRLFVSQPGASDAPRIGGQMLLLPLRDDLGHRTRVLGCLAMEAISPGRPARLDIDSLWDTPIGTGHRLPRPVAEAHVPDAPAGGAEIILLMPELT